MIVMMMIMMILLMITDWLLDWGGGGGIFLICYLSFSKEFKVSMKWKQNQGLSVTLSRAEEF